MIKKNIAIIIGIICLFSTAYAQETGVHFENDLNWSQVLKKAKQEHKGIFVDCYATWCGPCKDMDANVYPYKQVGEIYNKDFISIKLQMDRTSGDNEQVKKWYPVAKNFDRNYSISSLPTFLFLDENGVPLHKVSGSMSPAAFIKLANTAKDPRKQYYNVLKNFKPGSLSVAEEKGLALSFEYSDKALSQKLIVDYFARTPQKNWKDSTNMALMLEFSRDTLINQMAQSYISKLHQKQVYADANTIKLVGAFIHMPSDNGFNFFFHHEDRVNTIVKDKGYAESIVKHAIYQKEVAPILKLAKQNGSMPDWDNLSNLITKNYGEYAAWCIVKGKKTWYDPKKEPELYCKALVDEVPLLLKDSPQLTSDHGAFNAFAMDVFLYSNDSNKLEKALTWMNEVKEGDKHDWNYLDTKANLLYKLGRINDAISVEELALKLSHEDKEIKETLKKMNAGEPTWSVPEEASKKP